MARCLKPGCTRDAGAVSGAANTRRGFSDLEFIENRRVAQGAASDAEGGAESDRAPGQ